MQFRFYSYKVDSCFGENFFCSGTSDKDSYDDWVNAKGLKKIILSSNSPLMVVLACLG